MLLNVRKVFYLFKTHAKHTNTNQETKLLKQNLCYMGWDGGKYKKYLTIIPINLSETHDKNETYI